jgi:translation initiation factor IF-3
MQDFLADGHKVKVTLQFRGREMAHPELGSRILDAVIEQVGSHGKVETMARLEGRNMTMVLAPEKKAVVKKSHEPKPAAHDGQVARNTAAADASAPVQQEQAQEPEAPVADEPADQAETA